LTHGLTIKAASSTRKATTRLWTADDKKKLKSGLGREDQYGLVAVDDIKLNRQNLPRGEYADNGGMRMLHALLSKLAGKNLQ